VAIKYYFIDCRAETNCPLPLVFSGISGQFVP
jgi:hypothetical protein